MFNYYMALAVLSLKRNVVLTVLMIAAVGVGIGASMTMLTVFRAMAEDPIPNKSHELFAVQIDNWGPRKSFSSNGDNLSEQVSYTDAMALMSIRAAKRQSAMYATGAALTPEDPERRPFRVHARATYADFFPMFSVRFRFGASWTAAEEAERSEVLVISRELNDKVFAGANSVGKTLNLDGHPFRVVGVMEHWEPIPKFYDLNDMYGKSEEIFVPFGRAIENQMPSWGNTNCHDDIGAPGWDGHLRSECVWVQFWAELPTAAEAEHYRSVLNNYAADQQRSGRFHWPPNTRVRDVREWLTYQHVVSNEARILVLVSFSFLLVCLLNAMGLMLAKIMGRAGDIGIRRALGANRRAIFSQCLIEAGVVGLAGGCLGLALTALGLVGLRSLLSESVSRLTHLSISDVAIALILSIVATTLAGLYPTWRAAQVQPVWQLKAQ